jgi:hypothetical protein
MTFTVAPLTSYTYVYIHVSHVYKLACTLYRTINLLPLFHVCPVLQHPTSNTVQGGHRNLFIEDSMVVFATRYHKGYNVSGDVKIIHRYLPREVGELVV